MKTLRDIVAAFSYFSIVPSPSAHFAPDDDAIAWLPVVGLVIGAISGLAALGVFLLTHAQLAAAITAWVLSIALSGAIHVDGFLDCCDGLFAMASPARRLEIMRDPHHGTYAIVGMAIATVLWLYALAEIPPMLMPVVLPAAGFLARSSALLLRPGNRIVRAVYFVLTVFGLAAIPAAVVASFARRRLGGALSGDCYGAIIVVSEITLLMISAVSTSLGPGLFR